MGIKVEIEINTCPQCPFFTRTIGGYKCSKTNQELDERVYESIHPTCPYLNQKES